MGLLKIALLGLLGGLIALFLPASTLASPPQPPTIPHSQAIPQNNLPPGLPSTFWLGVANSPEDLTWMTGSGVAWNARYQYLAGGVNTGNGWATWWPGNGDFARDYMTNSHTSGYLPVFTYYQLLQSLPHQGASEPDQDFNNLNNAGTMAAYYQDFALLLQRAATYGQPVVIHVEPDFWGYMQIRIRDTTNNAADIPAAVSSSGYPGVAGYPNTVQGFAWALLHLRDTIAPNVVLAIHASHWAAGPDIGLDTNPNLDVTPLAQATGHFLGTAGIFNNPAGLSHWDLIFADPSDRDADWYRLVYGDGGAHWWDATDTTFPNFARYRTWLAALNASTGLRLMLWQIPIGNTQMRSENNTTGHYQDNRSVYFLGGTAPHLPEFINAGVIGLLWGAGLGTCTINTDAQGDGITNPPPINGNNGTATVADDDGGYLRAQAAAYYSRGALPLPTALPACGFFFDVPPDTWPAPYVSYLACHNIVSGYPDSTFHPNSNVTRGQLMKMVVNAMNWQIVNPTTPTFNDVPTSHTFYTFVETGVAHSIIQGYPCGGPGEPCPGAYFRPNNNITRGQLSKVIALAKGYTLPNPPTPSFQDVPVGSTFFSYVEAMAAHAIVAGYSCGGPGEPCPGNYFRPGANATRAQMSKILYNALTLP
jgi:hypothetical protein